MARKINQPLSITLCVGSSALSACTARTGLRVPKGAALGTSIDVGAVAVWLEDAVSRYDEARLSP